jgi:hypothetical protein
MAAIGWFTVVSDRYGVTAESYDGIQPSRQPVAFIVPIVNAACAAAVIEKVSVKGVPDYAVPCAGVPQRAFHLLHVHVDGAAARGQNPVCPGQFLTFITGFGFAPGRRCELQGCGQRPTDLRTNRGSWSRLVAVLPAWLARHRVPGPGA